MRRRSEPPMSQVLTIAEIKAEYGGAVVSGKDLDVY